MLDVCGHTDLMRVTVLQLPPELLAQILALLPLEALAQAACVSRTFRSATVAVYGQDPERQLDAQASAAHYPTTRAIRRGEQPRVQIISDTSRVCCSADGSELLQLRESLTHSLNCRTTTCTGAHTQRHAGDRGGPPNLVVIRSRLSTDDPALQDSQELPFTVPDDVNFTLSPKSWAPRGDHVLLSGQRALCLHLAQRTCTDAPPVLDYAIVLAWSPENTALVLHFKCDGTTGASCSLWDPLVDRYTTTMSDAAVLALTAETDEAEFVGHPTAIFLSGGGFVYIAAAQHNALIEWNYHTGHHRALGRTTTNSTTPSLFYLSHGDTVAWQSGQDMCHTAPGQPVTRIPHLSLTPSWRSPTRTRIFCHLVQRHPALVLAFRSGPHELRVSVPITTQQAWLAEQFQPYWVDSTSAFIVPLLGQDALSVEQLVRIAFRDY